MPKKLWLLERVRYGDDGGVDFDNEMFRLGGLSEGADGMVLSSASFVQAQEKVRSKKRQSGKKSKEPKSSLKKQKAPAAAPAKAPAAAPAKAPAAASAKQKSGGGNDEGLEAALEKGGAQSRKRDLDLEFPEDEERGAQSRKRDLDLEFPEDEEREDEVLSERASDEEKSRLHLVIEAVNPGGNKCTNSQLMVCLSFFSLCFFNLFIPSIPFRPGWGSGSC
jgi:hypothetical protein